MPSPFLSPRAAAALQSLAPSDAEALHEALSEAPPMSCIRAAILSVIRGAVARHAPAAVAAFDATCDPLPASPFAFIPIRGFVTHLATAAHLIYPTLPLRDAANRLTHAEVQTLHTLPVFTPMLRACEGDWLTYLKLVPQSHSLTYNSGSSDVEVHSRHSATLHYNGIPARAGTYTTDGYMQGMLDAFAIQGAIEVAIHDPLHYSVTVTVAAG